MALTRPRIGQFDTSSTTFSDPITVLHGGSTTANVDVGFLMNRANGLVSNVALYWNESGNTFVTAFTSNTGGTDSNILVTSYANVTTGAQIITPGTTLNSTSTSTGALVVTGGVGISGNLYVGGNISAANFLGNVFFGPTPTTTYYTQAPLNLTNSLAGGIKTQLNLINTGGGAGAGAGIDFYTYTSVAGSTYPESRIAAVDDGNYSSYITFQTKIPGNTGANALAERLKIDSAGNIVIPTTTTSTSTTTGALVVAGGVGISGNLNVGANLTTANVSLYGIKSSAASGNITITGNLVPSANITYDLGTTSQRFKTLFLSGNTIDLGGALITTDQSTGAVAIVPIPTATTPNPTGIVISPAGAITTITSVNGVISAANIGNAANAVTASSTSTFANASVTGNLIVGGNLTVAGTVTFTNSVIETSTETVLGVEIVGGNLVANSGVASTSTTTGALVVVGGAGISGNVFVGNITAQNAFIDRGNDVLDWNTLTTMGVYLINRSSWSGTSNTPINSQYFTGQLEVVNTGNVSIAQYYRPYNSTASGDVFWTRNKYSSSAWSTWVEIINGVETMDGGSF